MTAPDLGPDAQSGPLVITPLTGIPEVTQGDDLGALLMAALTRAGLRLEDGDVLVVSSKLVSKASGLRRPEGTDRQELVLQLSRRIVTERTTPNGVTRVVESAAGPVMAAAGIDASNTGPQDGLLLLPADPDLAAREVYARLLAASAPAPLPRIGVVLSDTAGRPWRAGQTDFALGACGLQVLDDLRGGTDADGRDLSVTARAVADEVAAAADLVKGKALGVPAAHLRGLLGAVGDVREQGARALVRTGPSDWFGLGAIEAVRAALGAAPGTPEAAAVGIPAIAPEPTDERLARAVRLALLGSSCTPDCVRDDGAGGDPADQGGDVGVLVVGCPEPRDGARLAARLEVALASEQLTGRVEQA